jgi:hypothetical protein
MIVGRCAKAWRSENRMKIFSNGVIVNKLQNPHSIYCSLATPIEGLEYPSFNYPALVRLHSTLTYAMLLRELNYCFGNI